MKTDLRADTKELAAEQLRLTGRTLIEGATGVGKTKMALDLVKEGKYNLVIVLVPTDTVADGWEVEIEKWLGRGKFPILTVNYKSAHKLKSLFDSNLNLKRCLILDECHHITERNFAPISLLEGVDMIALSATVDDFKRDLLNELTFDKGIKITIDQAVAHDLIVDYRVSVINFWPESTMKTVEAGKKGEKFLVTEMDQVNYFDMRFKNAKARGNTREIEFIVLQRMHFIRGLESRIKLAEKIIAGLKKDNPSRRLLVFCPTKKVAERVCPDSYLHSSSGPEMFEAFKRKETNILSSVNMLSEGINVEADMILILSAYSKERATIQQLGRILRKGADGKVGYMVILCAKGTQDEKWVESSTEILRNVKHYDAKKLGY